MPLDAQPPLTTKKVPPELLVSPRRPHRLGVRIVAMVLGSTLVFALLISALQIYGAYQHALRDTHHHLVDIEQNYLPLLATAMWSVDEPRIDALVTSIAKMADVGRVLLQDDVGQRWEKTHPEFHATLFNIDLPVYYEDNGERFLLGQLEVALTDNRIRAELIKTAQSIAITTLTSLLLSAIFVLFIIHWWISRHLEKMAHYAQNLDLTTLEQPLVLERSNTHITDELDLVAEAINQMRIRIRDDLDNRTRLMDELRLHREKLELLVAERTHALEEQTHALEEKTIALEQQSAALLEQNYELDAYAHTVAHDLKQPLTSMAASASLLSALGIGINLSEIKKRELLLGLQKSAKKMQAIIDSLLLLASLRKTETIHLVPLNIRQIAEEACNRLESLIEQNHARIELTDNWPTALGQGQWVEEVWVNYLSNALKYGGPEPRIQLGATAQDNGMVKCWVKDFGPGLNEQEQQQLFDLFVQFEQKSADSHGLGLSIVKRITRALNGNVGYEKSADGGSVFWFSLPGTR